VEQPLVLVIEDDVDLQEAIGRAVRAAGFRICQAFDGMQGVWMAKNTPPAIVLLDVDLPELDGIGVCKELAEAAGGELPIIMLTSHAEASYVRAAMNAGAWDYVTKPVDPAELLVRLRRAADLAEGRRVP
jgi:DNA-binding response OmpR family regulator